MGAWSKGFIGYMFAECRPSDAGSECHAVHRDRQLFLDVFGMCGIPNAVGCRAKPHVRDMGYPGTLWPTRRSTCPNYYSVILIVIRQYASDQCQCPADGYI